MPPYKTTPNPEFSVRRPSRSLEKTPQTRKKACSRCSAAKSRCDLIQPTCSRCRVRRLDCVYSIRGITSSSSTTTRSITHESPVQAEESTYFTFAPSLQPEQSAFGPSSTDFSPDPIPTHFIRGTEPLDDNVPEQQTTPSRRRKETLGGIAMRWIAAALPDAQPKAKFFSQSTIHFSCCYMRCLPLQLLSQNNPPLFIHHTQLENVVGSHLSHAVTLVQMWKHRAVGSEALVLNTIMNEMKSIFDLVGFSVGRILLTNKRHSYDSATVLSAFQSYLILTLLVYFHVKPVDRSLSPDKQSPITFETLLHLQSLADQAVSQSELICSVDPKQTLSFNNYVHAESLRRTVYLFCVFDDIYNSIMGLPTYVAQQLGNLPAPGPKQLWTASISSWENKWNEHRQRWSSKEFHDNGEENGLRLRELWMGDTLSEDAASRVDQWLGEADAFGMWILSICEMTGTR